MTNLTDYPSRTFVRTFDIEAISLPIVYNKYGDHDPNGILYVLKKDSERIQQKARENFAMWTLWRIFDRLEDGTGTYPDGTPIEQLMPLKDRPCPPKKDMFHPGYPNFINGEF